MIDPGGLGEQLGRVAALLSQLLALLDVRALVEHAVRSNLAPVLSLLNDFLVSTRAIGLPAGPQRFVEASAIRTIEPYAQALADAALVAVATWSFYRLMWSHSIHHHYAVRLLLPRLLLAVVLINFSLPLFQAAVDVNNALCAAVAGLAIPWNWSSALELGVGGNGLGATLVVYAAIFLGYVVLGFAYVVRYSLLVVLAITAPLAALMFVLPETHRYAREWATLFIAALFMQPLQLLVLKVGFMLDQYGTLPIKHLFALATLYIAFKVPGSLRSTSASASKVESELKHVATQAKKALAKV